MSRDIAARRVFYWKRMDISRKRRIYQSALGGCTSVSCYWLCACVGGGGGMCLRGWCIKMWNAYVALEILNQQQVLLMGQIQLKEARDLKHILKVRKVIREREGDMASALLW